MNFYKVMIKTNMQYHKNQLNYSIDEIFKVIKDITQFENNKDIIINVASGDKITSCFTLCAAYVYGLTAVAVMGEDVIMLPIMKFSYYKTISDPKLKILRVIIDDFISTAQPVGSRTLAKKYELGVSSATIRNEMADLEELGLLSQPHTSAGRIPSNQGYRLYVDNLMQSSSLGDEQRATIKNLLVNKIIEVEDVVEQAAGILAKMTGLTAMISLPQFKKSKLANMKLIRVTELKVLLIMVSKSGIVKSHTLGLQDISQGILDVVSNTLLMKLTEVPIEEINARLINSIKSELPEYANLIDYLVPLLRDTLRDIDDIDVKVEGINNIFNFIEYSDVHKVQKFLELIKDNKVMGRIFNEIGNQEGISIQIGSEIDIDGLDNCSMVSAPYKFNGKKAGKVCVVGPTRMDYSMSVAVVDYIRETLGEIFSGINL